MLIKYYYLWKEINWFSFPLFIEYLPFYSLGLFAGNNAKKCNGGSDKFLMPCILMFAGASFIEATVWNNQGKQAIAMSQGKITSYCFAMSVIMIFWVRATNNNDNSEKSSVMRFSEQLLEKIGNLSYGIFFVHMIFVYAVQKAWNLMNFNINSGLIYCVLNFIAVTIGSYLITFIMNRVFPKKVSNFLGIS